MSGRGAITSILLTLLTISTAFEWPFMYNGKPECAPQGTPLNGEKWCKFTRRSSEVGALCYFKCRKGYKFIGNKVNKCVDQENGTFAVFEPKAGFCESESSIPLQDGLNGPFRLYTQAKPDYEFCEYGQLLEVTNNYRVDNSFYIRKPGLNGVEETVSLSLVRYPDDYIAFHGQNLIVIPPNESFGHLGSWSDLVTFRMYPNKYNEGYSALEAFLDPNHFIHANYTSHQINLIHPKTDVEKAAASISWRRPSSTAGHEE